MGCLFLFYMPLSAQVVAPVEIQKSDKETEATYYFGEGMQAYLGENYTKALKAFEKAEKLSPKEAGIPFQIGKIYIQSKNFTQALQYTEKALELDPQNKYYYLQKASILSHQGNMEEAITTYQQMIDKVEDGDEYLPDLAHLYMYAGQWEKALSALTKAENTQGLSPEITQQKENILLKLNRLDDAIKEGKKLMAAYPGDESNIASLAQMMTSNNRYKEARKFLEEYLEDHPGNPQLHLQLAKIYQQLEAQSLAITQWKQVFTSQEISLSEKLSTLVSFVQKLPNDTLEKPVHNLVSLLLATHPGNGDAQAMAGDYFYALSNKDSAVYYYQKAIQSQPDNYQIWQNILSIYMDQNKYDSVRSLAEEAMVYFPNQPVLFLFTGVAAHAQKDYQAAAFALEQGKQLVVNNPKLKATFNSQLGETYNALHQFDKSAKAFDAVLADDPDNSYVLNNYSYYLALQNRQLDKALSMSSRLVQLHPDNATYLDTHAWVLYQMGQYQKAAEFLQKAIAQNESGTIVEHYGDALYKLGERKEAVKQWKKARSLGNHSQNLEKKINDKKLYE